MINITLKFPNTNKIFTYKVSEDFALLKKGDAVLVEDQGIVEAASVLGNCCKKEKTSCASIQEGSGTILKQVDSNDQKKIDKLKSHAREYLPLAEEKIKKHGLNEIKLLDADLSFDGKKLTFYFGAEGRIDFRELVTDLVRSLHKVIRLQQIGPRDEARFFGGYGRCGRELCCTGFLQKSPNITLDMAKEQELLSSSSKLSGMCGKLFCCLSYERDIYLEMLKDMPELGKEIKIGRAHGKVIARNILKKTVTLRTPEGKIETVEI